MSERTQYYKAGEIHEDRGGHPFQLIFAEGKELAVSELAGDNCLDPGWYRFELRESVKVAVNCFEEPHGDFLQSERFETLEEAQAKNTSRVDKSEGVQR